nr:uncharacterized protein LOC109162453 [Ipomoea batatas]
MHFATCVLYWGDVAREVWTYFGQTLGVRLHMYGIRQVCYDWWGRESGRCNRLPVLVIWELWVQYISSRYGSGGGGGGVSVARIIFKVVKGLSECIIRKWPEWELWGIPWKMSFMAWRVFRNKVQTDDVLSRFGFQCGCLDAFAAMIQNNALFATCVLYWGGCGKGGLDIYFGQTLGVRLHMYGIRQVLAAAGEGLKTSSGAH